MAVYVDDILLASNNSLKLTEIKDHLSSVFKMNDLGKPQDYLGMKITIDRINKQILLNQTDYIFKILDRFEMLESKLQNTPMISRQVRSRKIKDESSKPLLEKTTSCPYREAIRSLLYLVNATRPDISFAVNWLSRKQTNPTEDDWTDFIRILKYLRETVELGLSFQIVQTY